jgi:hypothetical protein
MSEQPRPKPKFSLSPKTIRRSFEVTGFFASIATIIGLIVSLQESNATISLFRDYLYFKTTSEASNGNELSLNATQAAFNITLQSVDSKFTPIPATTRTPTLTSEPTFTPSITPSITPSATETPIPTQTFTPTPDALFRDDFSGDSAGWDLNGSTRLSNGKLKVSIDGNQSIWLPIPNFKLPTGNFYVQAEMMLEGDGNCWQGLGFAQGEKDTSYHKFLLLNECDGFGFLHSYTGFYDNGQELFRTELTQEKKDLRKMHVLRVEVRGGLYTLLIDGAQTDSQQITPYGNDIGFYIWNYDRAGTRVYAFDNLVVKDLP